MDLIIDGLAKGAENNNYFYKKIRIASIDEKLHFFKEYSDG